jgi:hypothetical protein
MFIACSHMFPMILVQVPHVFLKAVPNRTSKWPVEKNKKIKKNLGCSSCE